MSSLSFAFALLSLFPGSQTSQAPEVRTRLEPGRFQISGAGAPGRFTIRRTDPQPFAQQESTQRRAWLGVSLQDDDGAEVLEVLDGSPAERARLRAGDRIVSLGGEALGSVEELIAAIRRRAPGGQVELVIEREVQVQLDDDRKDGERFLLGVYIGEQVDGQDAGKGEDKDAQPRGAWVTQVTPGYPATRAGLAAGDRLLSIDGQSVEDSEDVIDALAEVDEARTVAVRITRSRQVALGTSPDAPATQLFERIAPDSPRPPSVSVPAPFERNAALEEELRALSRELRELREQVTRLRAEIDRLRAR